MWAANMTRPDIAYTVCTVAKFCDNPCPVHKKTMKNILQRVLRTPQMGTAYGGPDSNIEMTAYPDSDYAE